jgi:threonine aldolase
MESPHTNILFIELSGSARDRAAGLLDYLRSRGILATGIYRLRFVTHLDVDASGIQQAMHAIREYFTS